MTHIAFFGHDAGDAAIRRRAAGFAAAGYGVTGFMMRRAEDGPRDWENIDLGRTYDAAYWQRLRTVFKGAAIAKRHAAKLRRADVIYARNLDMLICAMRVRRQLNLTTPVVYECLDVHHLLTGNSVLGHFLRKIERRLIGQTSMLVYSSPAFEREFFRKHYGGLYTPYLMENRLIQNPGLPGRPARSSRVHHPLRIGWFGMLRCHRSLSLLEELAAQFPGGVEIVTAGIPATTQVPDFERRIAAQSDMSYGGPYQSPDDLGALYDSVDLIWAGDFYQAGYNSRWLLPNRIYEGGFFSVPALAPADSETGKWVTSRGTGIAIEEPLEENLPIAVKGLLADSSLIVTAIHNLQSLPDDTFVQPDDEISRLIEGALATASRDAA